MIPDLEVNQDVQNIIDFQYSIGILNYLHKIHIIDDKQLQKIINVQKDKLEKNNGR